MRVRCWSYHDAGRDPEQAPAEIAGRLFAGELLVFRGLGPVRGLVDRARAIVEHVFGPGSPACAESRLEADEFRRRAVRARTLVRDDAVVNRCWRQCLEALGYHLATLHLDRVRLRVVPSSDRAQTRTTHALAPHRDSWGSSIAAQVNWWLPLYPLHAARTMLIWPEAFGTPVANTSAEWDYDELMRDPGRTYPLLPLAREMPSAPGEPVLIEPGELLAFSAAHLHAGANDDSGLTRFSLDTRTVWQEDVEAGRGAPDVDGAARQARWDWFSRPGSSMQDCKSTDPAETGGRHHAGVS